MLFFHPVSFHSIPFSLPPGLPERRNPTSRLSCAGGRASAPARFARLIARASQMQGALHPLAESEAFFAPARTAKRSEPADAASFLRLNIAYNSDMSIIIQE